MVSSIRALRWRGRFSWEFSSLGPQGLGGVPSGGLGRWQPHTAWRLLSRHIVTSWNETISPGIVERDWGKFLACSNWIHWMLNQVPASSDKSESCFKTIHKKSDKSHLVRPVAMCKEFKYVLFLVKANSICFWEIWLKSKAWRGNKIFMASAPGNINFQPNSPNLTIFSASSCFCMPAMD